MTTRPVGTKRKHVPERICALYSRGPHYVRMLRRLREAYPGEIIVAAIPEGFPFAVIEALADETIRLPDPGAVRAPTRYWKTLYRIRRARCSHLVVMFDSPRLNLLARLCGNGRRWCYTVDGRFHALARPLSALLLTPVLQRIRGEWAFTRARIGTARRTKRQD